jgi:hypothetical protein
LVDFHDFAHHWFENGFIAGVIDSVAERNIDAIILPALRANISSNGKDAHDMSG